ncbi:VOC family protein [Actinomadura harenae]|uniref:VOC family protein n=1 Tax=Actinomadura harenae TaxID=2483351 RepID=A0A3M2LV95_9ACTN|nr:VOC family protein [Actinomadura harenae]RMI41419.1 VOC family protein [Actinomadura harenae]
MSVELLGLRTVIYPAPDLAAAKLWWTSVLGIEPYFDEPFYVGYEVGGYELALDPDGAPDDGPIVYWGVDDAADAEARLIAAGGRSHTACREVGGGIEAAVVRNPVGDLVGVIRNPHFKLP